MIKDLKAVREPAKNAWRGLRRTPPAQLNRRQRLLMRLHWAGMYWDDAVPLDKGDRWYAPTTDVLEPLIRKLCVDHISEDDHCGMPAHRYCILCEQSTPNASTELSRSLKW